MDQKDSLLRKYITIFLVVSGYWIVSISTVFMNKTLLSHIKLDAPMFINFSQTLVTALICYSYKVLSRLYPNKFRFPEADIWDPKTIKTIFPVSLMFTIMIASNNLCLKYVSVAFYYVGRSLTTIFNVLLTYFILGERTSKKCMLCCAVIIMGFWLGVDQENIAGSLSVAGTIFGIIGSFSLSLFSILTKKVMPHINGDIWLLQYANNIYASILFIPLIIFSGELSVLFSYPRINELFFWSILIGGGLCGFSIGFFTSLQIKYTSALTHNISGTAKACAQTVLATYWYQETKSLLWWFSNFIILAASGAYARIKQLDMERKHNQGPAYTKV
ncbi:GDP-fucose transporter 1 [Anthonomus grandis grandis]|uniref:GDP-fucose transporter 1 n=1 Tax=Anthonomus grandis grandis TaxID=2921223 RepID=UPI0021654BF1|nr:GDP-fucose transporter 1 [Anthonomus grandis grandis]